MQNIFFTSDTHYGHANVIQYSNRPYDDVREMNESMIDNWNTIVQPGDLVYHLGDFAFTTPEEATKIAKRLKGQKYLVWGNHDKKLRKDADFMSQWIWAKGMAEIKVGDQKIVMCHYAMLTWNQSHRGAWNLHGHSHGSLKEDWYSLRTDVGVDCWNHYPVTFDELKTLMAAKTFKPIDGHGRRDEEDYGV